MVYYNGFRETEEMYILNTDEYTQIEPETELQAEDAEEVYEEYEQESRMRRINLPRFSIRKLLAICVALLILTELAGSLIYSALIFSRNGYKGFMVSQEETVIERDESMDKWFSARAKAVSLENEDNVSITGVEIDNKYATNSYIIICHPYGKNPSYMSEYSYHFYDLGFNVLLPVGRGHGDSPYENITMGWDDRKDILCWIDYIIGKDENAKIILFGVGMGGNTVANASGEELPENVKCVIADSCYDKLENILNEQFENELLLPAFPTVKLVVKGCELLYDWSPEEADTLSQVEKTQLPILFVHSEEDKVIPIKQSNDLYMDCEAEDKDQLVISEAYHTQGMYEDEERYWNYIDLFILNNIGM